VIDLIRSEFLVTIVLIQNQFVILQIHSPSICSHLNGTFDVGGNNDQWHRGILFGWILFLSNLIVIGNLAWAFCQMENLQDWKLTMNQVFAYIFQNNFWFLFLWLTATGSLVSMNMINHFGADLSFHFKWLSCQQAGQMSWPGCV